MKPPCIWDEHITPTPYPCLIASKWDASSKNNQTVNKSVSGHLLGYRQRYEIGQVTQKQGGFIVAWKGNRVFCKILLTARNWDAETASGSSRLCTHSPQKAERKTRAGP